jgi:hypothetical protein
MSGSKDGLQINEDVPYQRKEWRVQRIIWVFIAVLLVAALAGLLGPGPLSSTTAGTPAFQVEYLRFARWQAPQSLVVSAGTEGATTLRLAFDKSFLDSMQVQQITPQPANTKASGNNFIYTFATGPGTTTDVTFSLQPNSLGTIHGAISLLATGHGSSLHFTELVYP